VAAAALTGGLVVGGAGTASAQRVELAVNALAAEVTTFSSKALLALDHFERTGTEIDERQYEWYRSLTAYYTAVQLGYDHEAMIEAWDATTPAHQRAVLTALTQVGVPYRSMASEEGVGFDCSGLTSYAWNGAGVELYRRSSDQISDAERLSRDEAKAGDLVYYPGHVMMYLGVEDAIIHSVQTGRTVEIDTISDSRRGSVRFGDPLIG
jgi:hypothetical protein